jgi:hypothetical protein
MIGFHVALYEDSPLPRSVKAGGYKLAFLVLVANGKAVATFVEVFCKPGTDTSL